jgi:hypothetical protein
MPITNSEEFGKVLEIQQSEAVNPVSINDSKLILIFHTRYHHWL